MAVIIGELGVARPRIDLVIDAAEEILVGP
jgi:hypothetical protein